MSLYKRGGTYRYNFWFNGEHYQESTQVSNSRVAADIERARRTELAKGEEGIKDKLKVERMKVSDLLDKRLQDLRLRKKDSKANVSVNAMTRGTTIRCFSG